MNDLISRKVVIDILKQSGIIVDNVRGNLTIEEINRIPTAYDVDGVVEQLQQMKTRYFLTIANTGNETLDKIYEDVGNSIDKAIEIMKGAVKDE